MHNNEQFLTKLDDIQLMALFMEAELMGPAYLAALREQIQRTVPYFPSEKAPLTNT